jgi:hypothetical protein
LRGSSQTVEEPSGWRRVGGAGAVLAEGGIYLPMRELKGLLPVSKCEVSIGCCPFDREL